MFVILFCFPCVSVQNATGETAGSPWLAHILVNSQEMLPQS